MFTIIGKDNCPYCTKATNLLADKDKWYTYYRLEDHPWLLTMMREAVGEGEKVYVPLIFHNGVKIGGFNDLEKYLKDTEYLDGIEY